MTVFEMVKYHGQTYPQEIPLRFEEVAGHFDIERIHHSLRYSLHTEYSYGKRKFESGLISSFPALVEAQKNGVPQLWKNKEWASQFADFVFALAGADAPAVIEVHTPFNDYTDMDAFIQNYSVFEKKVLERYAQTELLIENRSGTVYRGGRFLISKLSDVKALCHKIEQEGLKLRVAFDIPQIYTAHQVKADEVYLSLLDETAEIRQFIGGVHPWGKRKAATGRLMAHMGDLNTYFGNEDLKVRFLDHFCSCFDDGMPRKMVLEVNSNNDDMISIISDLQSAGIQFV